MSFNAADLLRRLVELEGLTAPPKRFVIALSGGLDSTVLAHMLSTTRQDHGIALQAVHVDHRMQADSRSWARHCKRFAAELDLEFVCEVTDVDLAGGDEKGSHRLRRDAFDRGAGNTVCTREADDAGARITRAGFTDGLPASDHP